MLHFIPAWYQENQWCENEQIWYTVRRRTEFDDTVKQMQLFHRNGSYDYQILLLSFAPNFRHFLHRQGVYHAPYWSCFDAIQEVRRRKAMVLSFHNIDWPRGAEFIYSMFAVIVMLHGEKYGQIEFGEDGNPIQIDMYEHGVICRRNIYDDRGFVSGTVVYEGGQPIYQDYLMENGIWKLRCFFDDGHVEVNPRYAHYLLQYGEREGQRTFLQSSYESLEQVIREVFEAYLELTDREDIFCAAMHERHDRLLGEALKDKKRILSFFRDRYSVAEHPECVGMLVRADYVIADSPENVQRIQKEAGVRIRRIKDITPYDSRVDRGISQQIPEQKILIPVDDMEEERFTCLVRLCGEYLAGNERAQIHLFTRIAEYDRPERLLERTRKILQAAGFPAAWAMEKRPQAATENALEESENIPVKFFVEQCVTELAVSKCMREQRLLVDMRDTPEMYLQITAISMEIPQIVRRATQFIQDGKNGIVLAEIGSLPQAFAYYLHSLEHWNRAAVCSYELGKRFTTSVLMEEWGEVLDSVG